jgi:hypothetical protein
MSLVNNYSVICDESDGLFILNNAENRVKKFDFFSRKSDTSVTEYVTFFSAHY